MHSRKFLRALGTYALTRINDLGDTIRISMKTHETEFKRKNVKEMEDMKERRKL